MDDLGTARVAEIDAGDMLGAIAGLSRQVDVGYAAALGQLRAAAAGSPSVTAGAEALVVCGVGGSAIGADLVLACLPDLGVPAIVVRGHELPAWAGPQALVIIISYSGDTAEALACAEAALARDCRPVCVSSGGRLAALAADHGLPLVEVVAGEQPRAAVGSLSTALLATLVAAGLCDDAAADVAEAVAQLRRGAAELGPDVPDGENPAKGVARRLYGRLAVVYGAGLSVPAARRWKGQINENAKAPAFWNELPELDHNELMGWTSLSQVAAETVAIFLEDGDGDPRLLRRAELTAAELDARGVTIERVRARGASRLARLFSLVQLGDYASFYLALLYGVDPTPVAAIQDFKARLAGDAGA